ncbi:MAG TPA: ankyrin repeat domain-containing protein [Fimbriimonadaceae bacterium]|jgi:ankyrin repeat protein
MLKSLPEKANLDHLRGQAKDLLSSYRTGDSTAIARVVVQLPNKENRKISLHDAQRAVAKEYGFESWPKLVHHVDELNARRGITPAIAEQFISLAFSHRSEEIRKLLKLYPGLPRYNRETALVWGSLDFVRGKVSQTEILGERGWTPIEYVAYSRVHQAFPERYEPLETSAQYLLENGADPNSSHKGDGPDSPPLSALYGASGESFHKGIVKLLLEKGANPNDGESIYHAAQYFQPEILQLLFDHGANISDKTKEWGNTPIFFLCGHRPSDSQYETAVNGIEWFLQHGADPNITSYNHQSTPLHAAAGLGGTRLVDILLAHKGDPNAKRADGRTPYEIALVTGNNYAADALLKAGAKPTEDPKIEFLAAALASDKNKTDQLLKDHANLLEELSSEGGHVLVRLAELGNEKGVAALLAAGCPPNLLDDSKITPLHFASYTGRAGIVRLLLQAGAQTEIKDGSYNAPPLGWALHGLSFNPNPKGDYSGVIKALLGAGADPAPLKEYSEDREHIPEQVRQFVMELMRGTLTNEVSG